MTIREQVRVALDAAHHENEYPHEYGWTTEAIVREIHDFSGIVDFDPENEKDMAEACGAVWLWRMENPQ